MFLSNLMTPLLHLSNEYLSYGIALFLYILIYFLQERRIKRPFL
jgi:hypothetical protein